MLLPVHTGSTMTFLADLMKSSPASFRSSDCRHRYVIGS